MSPLHKIKRWLLVLLLLSSVGCSKREPPAVTYQIPATITLTPTAVRDSNNGVIIEGSTSLPDGTKIGVELPVGEAGGREAQDFNVFVKSGTFRSAAFSNLGKPVPPGKRKVHIFTRFNVHWQSPAILDLLGKGGSKLNLGGVIVSEDSELTDAEKQMEFSEEIMIPPLVDASAEQKAISLVKAAVLTVDGSKSSETVEGGAAYYFTFPGVRMGKGWSATPKGDGVYEVALDFVNTVKEREQPEKAIWEANLKTKAVLYRNKNAKNFSWIPNY